MLNAGQTQNETNNPQPGQPKRALKRKVKVEVDETKNDQNNRDQSNKGTGVTNKPPNKKGNTNSNSKKRR